MREAGDVKQNYPHAFWQKHGLGQGTTALLSRPLTDTMSGFARVGDHIFPRDTIRSVFLMGNRLEVKFREGRPGEVVGSYQSREDAERALEAALASLNGETQPKEVPTTDLGQSFLYSNVIK